MPAYNSAKYIAEAIESIKKQTYHNWELVILDDFSTDDTYKIAKQYIQNNIRVYRTTQHCGKIGQLKNECIAQLGPKHEYICHVGSDDKIPDYCFETFVNYMDEHQEIGACFGSFICFNDQGKEWVFPHVANSGEYDSNILLRYMCLFPHRMYRRSVVEEVGGYSDELSSAVDYDLSLLLDEKTKIHRIKEPITYYYRQHSEQVSTKSRKEQDLNAKTALENALKRRNIKGKVVNSAPPFVIEYEKKEPKHFIWGK
jgi:glycosyltransferase involved in cell wall biosynthesis